MRGSLKNIGVVLKCRVRMALALRKRPPNPLATAEELDRLVARQTAYWNGHPPLTGTAARQALGELNARSISMFVFSVHGRHIRMWDKPAMGNPPSDEQRGFFKRALFYRTLLAKALACAAPQGAFDFVLDVNDLPVDSPDLPIFAFQKEPGAHNMLLPDVDFFQERWYLDERDTLSYEQKTNSACFVGSSTGGWLSAEDVRRHTTPRLRAAAHFSGNPRVLFRIANATQCQSDEARACLRSQPYFSGHMAWADQLRHRFLISMDGNGAACSRLVRGLLSNSVVIKFDSPHELYYFPALERGKDYLPAAQEDDVERVLDAESACPGTFRHVAESGQRFARRYLSARSVVDYDGRLLRAHAGLNRR